MLTSIFVLLVVAYPLISAFLEFPRRATPDALLFLWLICLLPLFTLSLLAVQRAICATGFPANPGLP